MTSYKDAGVDRDEAKRAVARMRSSVRQSSRVLAGIGAFASVVTLPKGMQQPVLISATDGVGTKLSIASDLDDLSGIGQDLVAMCVNDLLTQYAQPLFFLDYIATPQLNAEKVANVVKSIDNACTEVGCELVGGETAELVGVFQKNRFDIAGFVVGVAERDALPNKAKLKPGDVLLGLPSSGVHANGLTLARMAIETAGYSDTIVNQMLHELLVPTRLYHQQVATTRQLDGVHAMAHITGGGLEENIRRALPEGLRPKLNWDWSEPKIFQDIAETVHVEQHEMRCTFNMGVGFVMCVAAENLNAVMDALSKVDVPFIIGSIESIAEPTDQALSQPSS